MTRRASFLMRFQFFATALLVGLVFVPGFAVAEEKLPTGSFVVMPAKQEVALLPGGEKTLEFTLVNGTIYPIHVDVSFEDVAPNTQRSAVDDPVKLLGGESGTYSLKNLLVLPDGSLDLISGERLSVPIVVRVPKGEIPGGRYGSVVFSFKTKAVGIGAPSSVAIESRIGSLVYLRILGETKEEGKLAAFELFNNAKTVSSPNIDVPLRFQVAFENTGDVYLNPYGNMTIADMWGKGESVVIDPWAVLPTQTRMREIDFSTPLSAGFYTAMIELNRGYGDVIDTARVKFFVLPAPLTVILWLIGIVVFVLLVRRSLQLSRHSVNS